MSHTIQTHIPYPNTIHVTAVDENGQRMSSGGLTVRPIHFSGREILCGAVGGVGTEPEYRRGGLVREIFTEMAAECDRRAIPLTVLHPFSFAYYRAFGFERVADHRVLEFPITALLVYLSIKSPLEVMFLITKSRTDAYFTVDFVLDTIGLSMNVSISFIKSLRL